MRIELVVFDLSGTTLHDDGSVNACFRAVLGDVGIEVSADEVDSVMGLAKPEALRVLLDRRGEPDVLAEADRLHRDLVVRLIDHYERASDIREVNGTTRTFVRLRNAHMKIAIETGFDRAITSAVLRRMRWEREGLIDAVVTSDEVQRGRPHPDMILRAMENTQVHDPLLVAKVGDTPADLHEGAAAGCGMVIGVTGGTHDRVQLLPHPHTTLIHTIAALPEALGLHERPRGARFLV